MVVNKTSHQEDLAKLSGNGGEHGETRFGWLCDDDDRDVEESSPSRAGDESMQPCSSERINVTPTAPGVI